MKNEVANLDYLNSGVFDVDPLDELIGADVGRTDAPTGFPGKVKGDEPFASWLVAI